MTWSEDQGKLVDQMARQGTTDQGLSQNLGSYGKSWLGGSDIGQFSGPSATDKSQSNAERIAERKQNYYYGGYAGGAADAAAAARGAVNPFSTGLYDYGASFAEQSGGAGAREAKDFLPGLGNTYGTADALTKYAQQDPGASVAQAQLEANTGMAMRQQLAMAGSGRGAGGGASAMRQAQANQAMIQGQGNAQASMLQAQEAQDWRQAQLAAYGQAGNLYGQGANLALGQAAQNDQYGVAMGGLANQSMQQGGMLNLGAENLVQGINASALGGSMGYEQNLTTGYGIDKGVSTGAAQNAQRQDAADKQFYATLLAAASDVRAKKNIRPADDEVTDTLRRLGVEQGEAAGAAAGQSRRAARRVPNLAERFSASTGLGTPVSYDASSGINRPAGDWRQGWAGLERDGAFAQRTGTWRRPERPGVMRGDPLQERRDQAAAAYISPDTGDGALADRRARSRANYVPSLSSGIDRDTSEFDARGTSASAYEYKDPERHGEGTYVGPMAQELEHVPGVVQESPDGTKAIDTSRLSLFNTSGLGEVQRKQDDTDARLDEIEGLLPASEDKAPAKRKAKKAVPALAPAGGSYADPELNAEEARVRNRPRNTGPYVDEDLNDEYFRQHPDELGPTTNISGGRGMSGRNIPMRLLDDTDIDPRDEEEIRRQFYDPSSNYQTWRL